MVSDLVSVKDRSGVVAIPICGYDRPVTAWSHQTPSTQVTCLSRPSNVVLELTGHGAASGRFVGLFRAGGKMSPTMEITFSRLDDRGSDREGLVEFLTVHEFPFHVTRQPVRATVEAWIDDGHFGDADHVSYWIHADRRRIGLVVFKDVTNGSPA